MTSKLRASLINYHNLVAAERGVKMGHDWSPDSQRKRFDVIKSHMPHALWTVPTVLDYGCGPGDLFLYLSAHARRIRYTGVDINPVFVEHTRKRYERIVVHEGCVDDAELYQALAAQPFDFVVASGLFNYAFAPLDLVFSTLNKLWAITTLRLIVNFLRRTPSNANNERLTTYTPTQVLELGLSVTDNVTVQTGYLANDTTLVLTRE
jgi:SAM-dependent methyltransferase